MWGIPVLSTHRMNVPEHIWLISGYAGSGKDTVAGILRNILGDALSATASFAGAVKDEVAAVYDFDRAVLDTQEGKARHIKLADGRRTTIRDLLIHHAETTKQKTGDAAIWAKRIAPPAVAHWILSDWRFLEELHSLQARFPESRIHTVRVLRPGVHPSASHTEHQLDAFVYEYTIENSGSLLYIGTQISRILEHMDVTNMSTAHMQFLRSEAPPSI